MRIAFRNIESQPGRRENPPSHKSQRHRGLVLYQLAKRITHADCEDVANIRDLPCDGWSRLSASWYYNPSYGFEARIRSCNGWIYPNESARSDVWRHACSTGSW